jgi:hypothetical protein
MPMAVTDQLRFLAVSNKASMALVTELRPAAAVAATRAVILEAIPVAAVGAVIPTPGAEVEDPTEDNEITDRTLKTTPKCSR